MMDATKAAHALQRYLERPSRRRFERMVRACQDLVYATAFRLTRNPQDAQDISQDVFVALLLDPPAPGAVKSPRSFLAWRVVGRVTNLRRSEERRRAREAHGRELARTDGVAEDQLEALRDAVQELPEELRLPIELRYFAGVSNRDVALALGLSTRAVEERLRTARERLRRRLAPSSLALLAAVTELDSNEGAVPAELARSLLALARRGTSLLAVQGPLRTGIVGGGALMGKKVAVAIGLVLVTAGLVSVIERESTETTPGVPAAAPPGRKAETPAGAAVVGVDTAAARSEPVSTAEPEPERATLRGWVWDDEEQLVPGARVIFRQTIEAERARELRAAGYAAVEPGSVEVETESDATGEYVLSALLPHKGRLFVEKEPYIRCYPDHGARPEAGLEKQSDVYLCRPHRVYGTLRSDDGRRLEGARIVIDNNALRRQNAAGEYDRWVAFPADENGDYDTGTIVPVVDLLFSDPLEVLAVADGHVVVRKKVHRGEFEDSERRIDFVLAPEMEVLVRVTDPEGLPIDGVSLSVALSTSPLRETSLTDADGRGRIEHLSPGEVTVYLSRDGYFQTQVEVDPESSRHVEVVLKPHGPPVVGTVLLDERLPEPEREPGELVFQKVRPDGRYQNMWNVPRTFEKETLAYRFFPPEPGRYSIYRRRGLVVSRTEPFDYDGVRSVNVDLPVTLEPPYVSGTVVHAETAEPVADLPVIARFVGREGPIRSTWSKYEIVRGFSLPVAPGNSTETATDRDGRFVLLLPRERFDFWSPASSRVSLHARSDDVGTTDDFVFLFDSDTVIDRLRLELVPLGAIEGQVLAGAGEPSVGELVLASNVEGTSRWMRTDREGRFLLEKLPPGDYFVEALGVGPSPQTGSGSGGPDCTDLPPPHEFFSRPVKVRPGEVTGCTIDLPQSRLGGLRGSVAPELAAAGGLEVEYGMVIREKPRPGRCFGGRVPLVAGRFELENLLPGPYRVSLLKDERILARTEVTIARGASAEVQLRPE